MKFTIEQIQELIEYLQGTCMSLDEGISDTLSVQNPLLDFDWTDLSKENTEQIDMEIFLCCTCGWWYEVCEMGECEEENTCEDCNND